ncbi:hypothetical protein B0H21DRAFT_761645 [Amylocystis lapponica]|nr:hypothetical protein B0H21DRAFT_761645 [Amylocystis lapponica]
MNREVLDRLPHRKIQKLAKRANVKANGSTEDIILRMLAKHAEGVPSPKTTVKPLPAAQAVKEEETEERDLAGVATRASTSAGLSGLQVAREDGGVSQSGRIPYSVSDDVDSRIGRHLDMSRARTCIRSRAPSPVASTSHGMVYCTFVAIAC